MLYLIWLSIQLVGHHLPSSGDAKGSLKRASTSRPISRTRWGPPDRYLRSQGVIGDIATVYGVYGVYTPTCDWGASHFVHPEIFIVRVFFLRNPLKKIRQLGSSSNFCGWKTKQKQNHQLVPVKYRPMVDHFAGVPRKRGQTPACYHGDQRGAPANWFWSCYSRPFSWQNHHFP